MINGYMMGVEKERLIKAAQNIFAPSTPSWVSATGETWTLVGSPVIERDAQGKMYATNDGSTANFYTTPNSAAASVTGDITILWSGKLASVAPATYNALLDKIGASGQYSWSFQQHSNDGRLGFLFSLNGTTIFLVYSTVPIASVGITVNARVWLCVQRVASTGVVKFFYSLDGITYTQLGADVATTAGNIFDSTFMVSVGIRATGTLYPLTGKTYRAQVFAGLGITGTPVVDFDPESYVNTGGANKKGAMWLPDPAAMYAAPDGAALAESGVGTGLLMDASNGMVLGAELVVNGNAEAAAMTISTSRLLKAQSNTYAKTGTYSNRFTQETVGSAYAYFTGGVVGSLYSVSASIYIPVGTTITSVYLANGGGVAIGPNATASTKGAWVGVSGWLFAAGSTYGGFVVAGATVGDHCYVDNYSMKQVLGNHAIQVTLANRPPHLVTPQTGRHIFVPSGTQVLTATMPNLGSCTVLRPRPDGTIDSTTETVNGAYNVTETNRVFCGCVVVQGTLTEAQLFVLRQLGGWYRPGLGAELCVNGDASNGTNGWTSSATYTATMAVVNGEFEVTGTVTYGYMYQMMTNPSGLIQVKVTHRKGTQASAFVLRNIEPGSGLLTSTNSTTTNRTESLAAAIASNGYLGIGCATFAGTSYFDNISAKMII